MKDETISDWLAGLSARQATPGGGAVAALSVAASAGLIGMVTNYTTGPKWSDREEHMKHLNAEAAVVREQALGLMDEDAKAFAAVGAAYTLPKATEAEQKARAEVMQVALQVAAQPPHQIGLLAARVLDMAEELVGAGNPAVVSDVAVAASMARAALEGAIINIEINAANIKDASIADKLRQDAEHFERAITQAEDIVQHVRQAMRS
jgi:methenyltetrahydrofolate cyclohydrolase